MKYLNEKFTDYKDPFNKNYSDKYCRWTKEVRNFVTKNNHIFTIKDVTDYLKSLGINSKRLYIVKYTIHYYEQSGLISYVPNYEGDELLFTNTKHFKKLWKTN